MQADDDSSSDLDKGIAEISLKHITDTSLTIQMTFNDFDSISSDIKEPDYLDIKFLKPEQFLDAETYKPLDKSSHSAEVQLKPQISLADEAEIQ